MKKKAEKKEWWETGIRFQCQGSGKCCTSHGEYGFVFLTLDDRRRMAKMLKISTSHFTKKYCDKHKDSKNLFHLKEDPKNPDCLFLKNKSCSIYEARPTQCRTWPFWPEVMNAKTWNKEVKAFCPGIGKGPMIKPATIKKILKEQSDSENKLI